MAWRSPQDQAYLDQWLRDWKSRQPRGYVPKPGWEDRVLQERRKKYAEQGAASPPAAPPARQDTSPRVPANTPGVPYAPVAPAQPPAPPQNPPAFAPPPPQMMPGGGFRALAPGTVPPGEWRGGDREMEYPGAQPPFVPNTPIQGQPIRPYGPHTPNPDPSRPIFPGQPLNPSGVQPGPVGMGLSKEFMQDTGPTVFAPKTHVWNPSGGSVSGPAWGGLPSLNPNKNDPQRSYDDLRKTHLRGLAPQSSGLRRAY